jgi:hypothetical protein
MQQDAVFTLLFVAWGIAYLTRRRPMGGWPFYFYFQLYLTETWRAPRNLQGARRSLCRLPAVKRTKARAAILFSSAILISVAARAEPNAADALLVAQATPQGNSASAAVPLPLPPPFYTSPPDILEMYGFTLYVRSWQSKTWDFRNHRIIKANGVARLSFDCQPRLVLPFPGKILVDRTFKVVLTVHNPALEIGLADAKTLDAQAIPGSTISVRLPNDAHTAAQISRDLSILLHWPLLPATDIEVQFTDLTIVPTPIRGTGQVLQGTATYPVPASGPAISTLPRNGFVVNLSGLTITPHGTSADGVLQMPVSVIDPGTGHPGRIALGNFSVTKQCVFHSALPTLSYGPWAIGDTEMQVQGTGVVADFDPAWASPGAPTSATATPSWEGVLLGAGQTIPPPGGGVVSNSGYVRGQYSYPFGVVVTNGFAARLTLTAPISFETLQPYGYTVQISSGAIDLLDSGIADGDFGPTEAKAPVTAATTGSGAPVLAAIPGLLLRSNLDLSGAAKVVSPIAWGDYTSQPASTTYYKAAQFLSSVFYISGTNKDNFFPLDTQDNFAEPPSLCNFQLPGAMQGLTVCFPGRLEVETTDTPQSTPLEFTAVNQDSRATEGWLNLASDGVHGRLLNLASTPGTSLDLGPVGQSFYVGVTPFRAALANPTSTIPQYSLNIDFVSSSVHDANMSGAVDLPAPVGSPMNFAAMGFTSTAQASAAQVPLTGGLPLTYWGVTLVKKNGAAPGAVMNVHTGEIFFTAAGIAEKRHFKIPFYLTWGEALANGTLGRLEFDYNSAGQQFDGFSYVPGYLKLSDYPGAATPYLKVAGNIAFDFFGAKYVNLNDEYDTSVPNVPYQNRRIVLMSDTGPQGTYGPTDFSLQADWGNGLGEFSFVYAYDANAQDGFIGSGTAGLGGIAGSLPASVVLKADPQICISVNDLAHHSFSVGPLANFGVMGSISGCGCVSSGQLQRIMMTAQLESDSSANVFMSSATYGSVQLMITPSLSQLELQGDMFLTLMPGGNVEMSGDAQFTIDRTQDSVDGNVTGHFDTSTLMGFQSVTADGQLDWHISAPVNAASYQELQGNLSIDVILPIGGSVVEGGFYTGINAPKSEAWVLNAGGSHFQLNTTALPDRLTGVYGYGKFSESVNLWIVSGGVEAFAGVGGFALPLASVGALNAVAPGGGLAVPYVIGNTGVHVWGEILGGLVSADGWGDMNIIAPYPFSFQGTIGLQACAAWVVCGSEQIAAGINSVQGLYVQ